MAGLTDKVAIVTGASRGIGKEIARGLAMQGAKVYACARSEDSLTVLAGEIKDGDATGEVIPLRIGRQRSCCHRRDGRQGFRGAGAH